MKRFFMCFLFVIGILFIVNINESMAATISKTYSVTEQITATLDTDGTLTISGTGEIPDYNTAGPWIEDDIKKVIVDSEITKIGKNAFANCSDLTSVILNEGLIQIESYAFKNTKLKLVHIPSTLKKIGTDAFLNVTTIESFSVNGGNNETFYTDNGVLYNHIYDLTNNKYYNQWALVAYPTASAMTNYTILTGTTDIDQCAFKNALILKQVIIPDSIQSIGANSFVNTGLTSITIPKVTLTTLGPDAFENNRYLKTVDFKADLKIWLFSDAKYLQSSMFRNCTALESVTFSGDIEEFGANVFYGCTSLNQITLPSTLKKIGIYCFQNCTGLENITFSNTLESIRDCAFKNCTELNQVAFPSSLVEVQKDAFYNCPKVAQKYPNGFELKSDNFYRKTMFVTISGTYDYDKAYEVFQIVNQERKAQGLPEYRFDVDISNAAMERSAELSLYLSHTRPDLSDWSTVLKGIRTGDSMNGENIAAGQVSAEKVMKSWMDSSGHKSNIMSSYYTTIGIGCYRDSFGNLYWTQIFVTGDPTNTNNSNFNGTQAVTKKREIAPSMFDIKLKSVPSTAYIDGTVDIHLGILNTGWQGRFTYAENSEIEYIVSDASVCKLENGDNSYTKKITFLKPGIVEISAILNGKTVKQTITVKEKRIPLENIGIDKQSVTLEDGETIKLNVSYTPENTTDDKTVTWTAYDNSIVAVDENGNVTGIKKGSSCVWARVGNISKICYITVKEWKQFTDVKSSDWFYNAVKYTYKNNIIKGYNDTTFAPEDKLTRGMMVTLLYRMEGSPSNDGVSGFTDVSSGEWYAKAVKWAVDNGIVHGYAGTTKFGPNDNIIRQDVAGMLRNYARYKGKDVSPTGDLTKFSDYNKVDDYAQTSMKWAVGKGVITGNTDGTLNPKGNATRAEASAMIQKYCNKVGK